VIFHVYAGVMAGLTTQKLRTASWNGELSWRGLTSPLAKPQLTMSGAKDIAVKGRGIAMQRDPTTEQASVAAKVARERRARAEAKVQLVTTAERMECIWMATSMTRTLVLVWMTP